MERRASRPHPLDPYQEPLVVLGRPQIVAFQPRIHVPDYKIVLAVDPAKVCEKSPA